MKRIEVRMRCIEALSAMGVREANRLVREAEYLEEWVMGASVDADEDKPTAPPAKRGRPPKQDNQDSVLAQ